MIKRNRVFYSDEIEVCERLANQIAVAIGKARYLKELYAINKIALDCGANVPLDPKITVSEIKEKINDMLEIVRRHAGTLLDVKNFYIALYDEKNDYYSFVYHDDERDDISSIPQVKWSRGLTGYVFRTKEPILANDEVIKKLANKSEIELVGHIPRICLGVPLITRGKVLGVMAVQNYYNEYAYDEHDLTVLQTIAAQTAIAIDNAQLFKDAQSRIRDLEIVNNILHIMSTKLDTHDLLVTMVNQIAENLNCSHCTIFLPEKEKGELKLVPIVTHGKDANRIMTRIFLPGEGLAGWVFQNGESIVIPDARMDIRYAPPRSKKKLPRSMLVAPLKVGTRTIGVICAQQEKINWFSESDRQLVDTLTRHAGIAIDRALGLNLLQEIGLKIISIKEEKETLQRIITGAIELTNTTSGIIYSVSDEGKSVVKSYPFPTNLDHPPPRMDREKGLTRYIIRSGEMIIIPDISEDDRVNHRLLKYLRALIGVPLKIGDKVVGVLFLHDKKPRFFTETEISLLEILADQAAIAIYNSRLYQESQRQLEELEALYETSQEIVGKSMNIKSVLNTILEKAVQLSGANSAQFFFKDEVTNQIKLVFTHGADVLKGITQEQGEGLISKVFESGESMYTGDYHKHPYRVRIFDNPKYMNLYNSLAIVPLKWQGEVLGAIALTSKFHNNFTEKDIQLLERFSGTAAISIAIAREISFRQTLLNNSPGAIVSIDKKGVITEFNKAAEQIYGYTMDEVLNKSVVDLWGGIGEARQINTLLHNSKNGTVRHIETFIENKKGEKIPVLFSGSLLYAEDYGEAKEEIGSIGHIEDQRILSLKGRVRKLFDAIVEINRSNELHEIISTVLSISFEFFEADIGCIMLYNDGHLEIVESDGFPKSFDYEVKIKIGEGLIGKTVQDGTPVALSDLNTLDPCIPFTNEGKSALILPLKIDRRLIGLLYLESNSDDYFRVEDELLQILSAEAAVAINRAQLMEEREKTIESLFASAKAVAAGELATGFMHEVKNSLNTIAMTVGNIGKRIQKEPDIQSKQEYIDKINTIETEIWRSYELSKRLQRFGQRLSPQKGDVYLNNVVMNTLELLESTLKKQKISYEIELDSALDKHEIGKDKKIKGNPIHIDKSQIEQVIINLILNAIEASKPRSCLLVETKLHESIAEIKVTDYGKGIISKDLPEIFKPFFTTKPDGVGLGLYISKLIVEDLHQGKIIINTKLGKGTTFSVQLPIKTKFKKSKPEKTKYIETLESKKLVTPNLLVVEDELAAGESLKELLRMYGHEVTLVTSGKEAIKTVLREGENIDAILMDIKMEGEEIDGIDAVCEIQKSHFQIPTIFVTAHADDETYHQRVKEANLEILYWIDKPILGPNKEKLIRLIDEEIKKKGKKKAE